MRHLPIGIDAHIAAIAAEHPGKGVIDQITFQALVEYPFRQNAGLGANLVVRTTGDPTALAAAIRNETRPSSGTVSN